MTTMSHSTQHSTPEGSGVGAKYGELSVSIILFAMGTFMAYNTATMDVIGDSEPGPQFFPSIVAFLLFVSSIALGIRVVRAARRAEADGEVDEEASIGIDWKTLSIVVAAFVAFLLILQPLGWLISAAALFFLVSFALGTKEHLTNLGIAAVFSAAVQIAFSIGLGLNLPAGILGGIF